MLLALMSPALTGGALLAAQAVERTDVPARGVLRVTFDPRIMTWNDQFTDAGRMKLGAPLTGDTVGGRYIPVVARLEQNVRVASGLSNFVASLGAGLFSVRQERRTYPMSAEFGITDRLSVSLMVPIVRVSTRASLQLSNRGATLGVNPLVQNQPGARGTDSVFFAQFDSALARLDQQAGGCAPPPSPCAARDSSARWHAVRDALHGSVYGVGQTGSPFLPLDTSPAGKAIDTTIAHIRQGLNLTFGIAGFDTTVALASDTLTGSAFEQILLSPDPNGFGYASVPFRRNFRYRMGDVELAAKYRLLAGAHYAAAVQALVRLPTGAKDSADDFLMQWIGDHQLDLEGRVTQEVSVGPLWLNLAVHAGVQRPGTRVRRVAPWDAFLVPAAATAALRWDPGDYVGVDVAPLVRLAPEFAAGFTAGYFSKARDHYAFQSAQDSVALATRLGFPTPASVLDAGTSQRWLRLGFALTYHAPSVEGGFSIEQTVSAAGLVPGATVYRIVLRTTRKFF
ncbi:MAG: hypothetical protein DMD60_08895 [Gemmatimonadetes bacterium]|nr:MAG: hypothetical protein DMD60_08895 [Gemmatimonadota bacterium]